MKVDAREVVAVILMSFFGGFVGSYFHAPIVDFIRRVFS